MAVNENAYLFSPAEESNHSSNDKEGDDEGNEDPDRAS